MIRQLSLPVLLSLLLLTLGCSEQKKAPAPQPDVQTSQEPKPFSFRPKSSPPTATTTVRDVEFPVFREMAQELGIQHVFDNGASPKALMVESTGGGCGWCDYDRDGHLDLYLTQGGIPCRNADDPEKLDALFRQTAGRFHDVAENANIVEPDFGHGVACGDFDNDGFVDLFVANAGQSKFFRNLGDGTFIDETWRFSGLKSVWSSTPAWGDIDRDGDIDLYLCNYAIYDPCNPVECLDKHGIPSICHPRNVEPEPDLFFLNNGDGELLECSQQLGLYGPGNKALGVVVADLNADRWPDIYVANDTTANFLFINDGTGQSFRESALLLGGGYSATGEPQASMGVGFGDFDNNLFPDLILTHFTGEHYTLYKNLGPQGLHDVSSLTGLREPTLPKLGFGTIMSDFNGDNAMDIFFANGHIDPRYEEAEGYAMTPQLFSFNGTSWQECSSASQEFLQRKAVGRGVASGDLDADGDLDICVANHNSPVSILRNDASANNLFQVRLIGTTSNRDSVNALVQLRQNETVHQQELPGGTSYAASHEAVLSFPCLQNAQDRSITVVWPSGQEEILAVPQSSRSVLVIEGRGIVENNWPLR